jgi:hypothetical protein
MGTKPWSEIRAKLSPERRERVDREVARQLAELPPPSSYFVVSHPETGRIRFETLKQDEATGFARGVYTREKVLCDIDEVPYGPVDHSVGPS